MKRKHKRNFKKKLAIAGFFLGILSLFTVLYFNLGTPLTSGYLKASHPFKNMILFITCNAMILLEFSIIIFSLINWLINAFTKPNKRYFELVNFDNPTDEVIERAAEGILNSEKTKPYFVHAAPINDEIEELYNRLNTKGFIWVNGRPGAGKSMLAYHALYRYREPIFKNLLFLKNLRWPRYNIYKLELNRIKEDTPRGEKIVIDDLLEELDSLKGGKQKIILVDDAHKIQFENNLLFAFEQEAIDKVNGKFVWINTNYIDTSYEETVSPLTIDFEKFFDKLLKELYYSEKQPIKSVIQKRCPDLNEAIKLKNQEIIKDPWHFNFVATRGEERISKIVYNLGRDQNKRDILRLATFLFSARNIMSAEKLITEQEFCDEIEEALCIIKVRNPYTNFRDIVIDLAQQENGRLLIIDSKFNEDSAGGNFLQAPHYRMSIAIVKTMTKPGNPAESEKLIRASSIFLKNDYLDSAYLPIYFRSIDPTYRQFFLNENSVWIKNFMANIDYSQLYSHAYFLHYLRKEYSAFYSDLISGDYFEKVAPIISQVPPNKLFSAARFIGALKNEKTILLNKLDYTVLATTANNVEVAEFKQLADFIISLGRDRAKFVEKLDFKLLTQTANRADVTQLTQLANFINILGKEKIVFIGKLDIKTLAQTANKAKVTQLSQVADIIHSLGEDRIKFIENLDFQALTQEANKADIAQFSQLESLLNALQDCRFKLIDKLDFLALAQTANKVCVTQLKQLADFINILRKERTVFIGKLDIKTLAQTANKAKVTQLSQVADVIHSLGEDRIEFIENLDFQTLAQEANKADIAQFSQLESLLNALQDCRFKLIDKLDFLALAQTANKACPAQLMQLASFIYALGADRTGFCRYITTSSLVNFSKMLDEKSLTPFCIILSGLEIDKQYQIVQEVDWISLLSMVHIKNSYKLKELTYILSYHIAKCDSLKKDKDDERIKAYLSLYYNEIIYFSSQYFAPPDDYQAILSLIITLQPYAMRMVDKIVVILGQKIMDRFSISPIVYHVFSNLLTTISKINFTLAQEIYNNNSVWEKLIISITTDDIRNHTLGLQSLLKSINLIVPSRYKEFATDGTVREILLTHFGSLENVLVCP
jgi:hypothetical protein